MISYNIPFWLGKLLPMNYLLKDFHQTFKLLILLLKGAFLGCTLPHSDISYKEISFQLVEHWFKSIPPFYIKQKEKLIN